MAKSLAIVFIGPLPLPVHGQAVSTDMLRKRLIADGLKLRVIDTNSGTGGAFFKVTRRVLRMARAVIALSFSPATCAYISVNANRGMAATSLFSLIARLRGHNIVLHHHTRSHLVPGHPRMQRLVRAAGPRALHIGVCASMCDDIQRAAKTFTETLSYSNIGAVDVALRALPLRVAGPSAGKTIGHMSNLTMEKGLGRVIDSFRAARQQGLASRLLIAGPADEKNARDAIAAARTEFGIDFHWMGPAYDADKIKFFQEIDVFLFPSLYQNETQGIVNLEALAAGVPVLAYAVCCTASDLLGPAAATVPPDEPFAPAACKFLECLEDTAPSQARRRFDTLLANHLEEYVALRSVLLP